MRIVITIVIAMLCACTAPNPVAHVEADTDGAAFVDGTDGDGEQRSGTDGGQSEDADGADQVATDDPATCDGVSERPEVPTCHGGALERATDGAIVCHWDCVGHAEITAVVVESAPGCFTLDDMICHQCTASLPRSWDPAPMPCPDVVRMLW